MYFFCLYFYYYSSFASGICWMDFTIWKYHVDLMLTLLYVCQMFFSDLLFFQTSHKREKRFSLMTSCSSRSGNRIWITRKQNLHTLKKSRRRAAALRGDFRPGWRRKLIFSWWRLTMKKVMNLCQSPAVRSSCLTALMDLKDELCMQTIMSSQDSQKVLGWIQAGDLTGTSIPLWSRWMTVLHQRFASA